MDMEQIENDIEEARILYNCGFSNKERYEEYLENVVHGLIDYGDLFLQALGRALMASEFKDSLKILRYWSQECEQHALLYRMALAKQKAEEENEPRVS